MSKALVRVRCWKKSTRREDGVTIRHRTVTEAKQRFAEAWDLPYDEVLHVTVKDER